MEGKWRLKRGIRWLVGLLLGVAVLRACNDITGVNPRSEKEREACEHPPIIARLPSPDGAWEAVVYKRVCTFGSLAGQTGLTTGVGLVSTRDPFRVETVLGVSSWHDDMRPRPVWVAPDLLRIDVRNLPFLVKVLTCGFGGVRIDLRFDPDTPETEAVKAKRDEYLREYKLPPDPSDKVC